MKRKGNDLDFVAAQAMGGDEPELPAVNDLEVAALAAAADMSDDSNSSETSSESSSSDSDSDDSDASSSSKSDIHDNEAEIERVALLLNWQGESVEIFCC